ncbi:DNRLRE domain-containing protein [Paenibacillus oryzisoli]|uniref:CBM96 family carbohydrate-binding protein n=1 Tax=Paenibacillus oryzisoli TaxID=1850517 RepID=UPI003D2693F3
MNSKFRLLSQSLVLTLVLTMLAPWLAAPVRAEEDPIYQGLDTKAFAIDYDQLESYEGAHPRLLMDASGLADIHVKSATPAFADVVAATYAKADDAVSTHPPLTVDGSLAAADPVFSSLTDIIPTLAMAYVLSGDQKYLDSAVEWIEAVCGYPQWQPAPDLATGQALMALAQAYDWLFADLDEPTKATMRAKMLLEGGKVYEKATLTRQSYWNRSWLQNHNWVAVSGMAAAAMAMYDEEPTVLPWLETANRNFSTTMSVLPEDGANHEGMDYLFYGMESLFTYADMANKLLGTDLLTTEWFSQTSAFLLQNFLPVNGWTKDKYFFAFGDSTGNGNVMEHMLRLLASRFNDGNMQWLADQTVAAGITTPKRVFMDLFWYDPSVPAISPAAGALPTMNRFSDLDIVNARSSWDGDESALFFRSGPPLGHKELELSNGLSPQYDWGSGHVDPAAGSFLLFGNGESLIRDDGYAWPKLTLNHNSMTIDGQGQLGEGGDWMTIQPYHDLQADPNVAKATSSPGLDYMVGDATAAYDPSLGLTKYRRHLLFLKPDVLIVVDDVALDAPRTLDFRFWPENQYLVPQSDNGFLVPGTSSALRIVPLTQDGLDIGVDTRRVPTRYDALAWQAVKLSATTDDLQNAVAFSWSAATDSPQQVGYTRSGNEWTFTVGNQTVSLNTATDTASLSGTNDYRTQGMQIVRDGQLHALTEAARTEDGTVMVPFASVFDALGATWTWNGTTHTATGNAGGSTFALTVGDPDALVDGSTVTLRHAPSSVNDTVYVPLQLVGAVFHSVVSWDGNSSMLRMTSNGTSTGANASLMAAAVNGKPLDTFVSGTFAYTVPVVGRTNVPSIVGIPADAKASVETIPAQQVPGTTTVVVTSADGSAQSVYTFDLVYQYPRGAGTLDIVGVTSSDPAASDPMNAIDNDSATFWSEEGIGKWLQFDLGTEREVSSVALAFYAGDARTANLDIALSPDGDNWTTVFSGSSSGTTQDLQFFDFAATNARYVKVIGRGNSKSAFNSITEAGIFDSEPFMKEVSLTAAQPRIVLGHNAALALSVTMGDTSPANLAGADVRFASDLPSVASVDGNGVVTANGLGTANISVVIRMNGQTRMAQTLITVYDGTNAATFAPTDDAYTVAWRTNDNFGSLSTMEVKQSPSDPGANRNAYMKFDLSSLAGGGNIVSAKLHLYATKKTSLATGNEADLTLYGVADDTWTEMTLTAANRPALGTELASGVATAQGNWLTLDVTSYVYGQHAGDGVASFGIGTQTSEGYVAVLSKETSSANYQPYLEVTTREGASPATLALSPASPNGLNGWYTTPVTATLGYTDPFPTGATLEYSLDAGNTWQPYASSLMFDEDGTYELQYRAKDGSGNPGLVQSRTIAVDMTAPTATIAYSVEEVTYGGTVATLVPSEPVTITNNGGSSSYTFSANGSFTFNFADAAGHTGTATAAVYSMNSANYAPTDDAYTITWRTNDNFGSLTAMEVKQSPSDPGTSRYGYMKFDLSSLASGSRIVSAKLHLYAVKKPSLYSGNEVDLTLYGVADDMWTESALSEANRPALGTTLASGVATTSGNWIELDVTPYVYAQYVGDGAASIGIGTQTSEGYVAILSKETSSATYRPYLTVMTAD